MSVRAPLRNEPTAARRHRSAIPLDGWERALFVVLVLMLGTLFSIVPGFWSGFGGFAALTEDFLPFGIVSLGLATVVLTGGIDLSVGATASLSAIVMAALWHGWGTPIWFAAGAGLLTGLVLGLANGLIVTRLGTEPLIATLATSFIYASVATAIAGANPPSGFPAGFDALGTGAIAGLVPYQLVLFAVLAGGFWLLLARTPFGRKIVMIGFNHEAATWSGVRTGRILLAAYALSGLTAACAGIVLASYYSAVRPDMGDTLLLAAITTVVLGGISIFGGEGHVAGVVLAVLLLGFLRQGLLIAGVSDMITTMVTGAILLGAIALRNAVSTGNFNVFARLLAVARARQHAREREKAI